ncbi:MAG: hypothetical protein K8L97_22440 [Anaerolineae bacterium]|nr:hypothetical protein [Anaerolineae bacterium]
MLRGFRWQILVLVMAVVLFAASLLSRQDSTPQPTPVPTAETTSIPDSPTQIPLPTSLPGVIPPSSLSETPTYREALVGNIQRLNPLFANLNPVDRDISSLIFEGLTRIDAYGQPVPGLAKSWIISSDALEYIVQLREDVLWQDGIGFNATDVIYTFSLLQANDFPGDAALGAFWRTIEVELLDTYLVRFRLTQPLGNFLDALSIGILPEHALRGTTAAQISNHPFNLSPIGTGPYQLEAARSISGSQPEIIDLRTAPAYRQRPEGQSGYALDRLTFRLYNSFEQALSALRSGEVDGLAGRNRSEREALLGLSTLNIHTAIDPTLGVLIFNWQRDSVAFFREQRVRIGLQTGLDRSSIIERYLSGAAVLADSPLIPGSWAYSADLLWPRPSVEAARQLLETANLRRNDSNAEATAEPTSTLFSFSILVPNDPILVGMMQEVAAQWSQLNITVTVDAVDLVTYQSRLDAGEFDAALVELSMGQSADPDVYQFWDQEPPEGKNYGGMDDRRINEELERARRDPNGINRIIRYTNFQRTFIERAIAIPLYYPLYTYVTAPQISGIQLGYMATPASRFYTLQDWGITLPN